jgi:hypothetical protein
MPRPSRALGWMTAWVCAACQAATAPVASPAGEPQPPPPFEVGVDGVYLTQSVQDYAGTVPLVEGRAGLLRIFLRARRPGYAAPAVRVHVVETATGAPLNSYTARSPLVEVPTDIVEGALGGSWNVAIPGADVRPGRHIAVEMDDVPGVASDESRQTFRYPAQGSLDVRPARQLLVTLVPVVQSGLDPEVVSAARTADSWIDRARWIHPLGGVDVEVTSRYTTGTALGLDGTGWADLLAELDRKRVADGSARTYLGVVKVAYPSGTVGRGDMGGRTALAWDEAKTYQRVAAHELGHNFGLRHAPCGAADPSSFDPGWPSTPGYADAHIGVFGWDPVTGALKDPAANWDHMSYCGDVHSTWTSDHNYRAAMAFLAGDPAAAVSAVSGRSAAALEAAPGREPCLLVSGRVRAGQVELEPSYVVEATPSPLPDGEYALELLDRGGLPIASFAFAPTTASAEEEGHPEDAHFAMAVPLQSALRGAVGGLAVRRRGVEVARRMRGAPGPGAVDVGAGRGRALVRWDHGRHPEVMVRDPRSGEVLAFARGGAALVHTDAAELELLMSDGVLSEPVRARAR